MGWCPCTLTCLALDTRRPDEYSTHCELLYQFLSACAHRFNRQCTNRPYPKFMLYAAWRAPVLSKVDRARTPMPLFAPGFFWYAHVHEGTTNALRGGRLVLNNDDLIAFQQTLPPHPTTNSTPSSSLPSPVSPTFSDHCHSATDPVHPRASLAFVVAKHYFSLTLNLSSVCRHIHTVLTGPKARKGPVDHLDEDGLRDAWEGLERCWDEFEVVRRTGIAAGGVSLANSNT